MKIVKKFFYKLKTDILKKIKKAKKEHLIQEYMKENQLFLVFIAVSVLDATLLRFLCMHSVENYLSWKALLADTFVATLIASFGYLLKPKNRFVYYMGFCIFLTAICIINSVYYTFYTSFASISMLSLTQYIGDVGDAVVENVLQPKDVIYLIAPITLFFVYAKSVKKNYSKKIELKSDRKRMAFRSLVVSALLFTAFITSLSSLDVSRFLKQWNKEYIVMRFGIYIYQANDVFVSLQPRINSMFGYDKAKKGFNDYFAELPQTQETNEYTNIFEGKNVIVIHAESMMTNTIGLTFNGKEVVPNLNRLSEEGMFFSNFYSQVSVGTSSDSELTFNTSLMPTKSGTAFVSYSDKTYIGIPSLLKEKGYYTFSMHANNADFWNRRAMHKNLGYDRFYSKKDYEVTKENTIGLGLSDKEFFKQSIEKMKEINENHEKWYGLLIMLSNHTPFSEVEKYGEFPVDIKEMVTNEEGQEEEITYPYMEGTKLGNYFKSVHYADEALGEFIQGLDEAGLLENTVLVLYGDHDARLPRKEYNLLYNYDKETNDVLDKEDPNYKEYDSYQYELGRKVPFIIWTKNMKGTKLNFENNNVMGMYDVVPTLGNMLGFYNAYALGHDIYNIKENNIVVFPNGNWINNKLYYNSQKVAYLPLTEEEITEDEINANTEYTNHLLDVSNDMIVFDLLNKEKNTEKEDS